MKNINLYLFTIGILFLASCERFLEQDLEFAPPKYDKQLAIRQFHSNLDDTLVIAVSRNFGILEAVEEKAYAVTNARVEWIEEGSMVQVLGLDTTYKPSAYTLSLSKPLQSGKSYEIRISHPDFPTLSAQQRMPDLVSLDSAVYEKDGALSSEGDRLDQVRFYFNDPTSTEDYYEVALMVSTTCMQNPRLDPQTNKIIYDTLDCERQINLVGAIDPNAQRGDNSMLITDKTFNGQSFTFGVNFRNRTNFKSLKAIFRNLTRENYLYKSSRTR